jgi:glycosyltransferase involved in cell wall biosynthesis
MRIVIDLQSAQCASRNRGIGRYSLDLAVAIVRNRGEHEIFIVLSDLFPETIAEVRSAFHAALPPECIRVWTAHGPLNWGHTDNLQHRLDAEAIREAFLTSLNPDLILVASMFEGFSDDTVTSIGRISSVTTAVVLYDLIPFIMKDAYLADKKVCAWYMEKLDYLKKADLLLSISESAGREAVEHLGWNPDRVINISTAANPLFKPLDLTQEAIAALKQRYSISRPYVMYTGGIDPRKNIEGLIRGYALLPPGLRATTQLMIVCSIHAADKGRLQKIAETGGLRPDELLITGYVPDADLNLLYNACKLLIFPSKHEGFGLPALEAMSCGKAVIASNISSLPEVIGRIDALFDPHDDKSIAAKLLEVLTQDDFRENLEQHGLTQAQKFNWDITATRALVGLERIAIAGAKRPIDPPSTKRRRIAFVSPLPPERSGISDYSAELLPLLSQWYEIDVIVAQAEVANDWINSHCRIRSVRWFRANSFLFDRVLYHIGNSEYHQHMFELMKTIPGVTVLHDFFLSGIMAYMGGEFWDTALFSSHGYAGLVERQKSTDPNLAIRRYSANIATLQASVGIIVHSRHAGRLAEHFYGVGASEAWKVIPLLRLPAEPLPNERRNSREFLNLPQDAFVVCCFGMLAPTKLNHSLVDAFLGSTLAKDPNSILIFVGARDTGLYGCDLDRTVSAAGRIGQQIRVTGWVDAECFSRYLRAADIAVQLRTHSRGETSAAVLDCMNHGLPTVVNANGSMAEIDADSAWLLPDEFSIAELVAALECLARDPVRRAAIAARARHQVVTYHAPSVCAEAYHHAIEQFYKRASQQVEGLIRVLSMSPRKESEQKRLAALLAKNFPPTPRLRQLLVDISKHIQNCNRGGIDRVVKCILINLLSQPPAGWVVEPVFAEKEGAGFRYARSFAFQLLGINSVQIADESVDAWAGDVVLCLDLDLLRPPESQAVIDAWQRTGVAVHYVVYDLLPIHFPKHFPADSAQFAPWLHRVANSTGAVCISQSVAEDLRNWVAIYASPRAASLQISWFHLGADIDQSQPTHGLPVEAPHILARFAKRPTFLAVATLEPRKGHRQLLAAFETLWARGIEINLALVGKQGWLVQDFVALLSNHPEMGRRLFWLSDVKDDYLEHLYRASTCLIAASEGEGFGLPLIEAAKLGLPILARDLAVFREIAGIHATYFDGSTPADLTAAIDAWLARFARGEHRLSNEMPWLTWAQSTAQLLGALGIKPAGSTAIADRPALKGSARTTSAAL